MFYYTNLCFRFACPPNLYSAVHNNEYEISLFHLDVSSHLLHRAQCSHIQDILSSKPPRTSSQARKPPLISAQPRRSHKTGRAWLGHLEPTTCSPRYLKPYVYMCKCKHVHACLLMSTYVFHILSLSKFSDTNSIQVLKQCTSRHIATCPDIFLYDSVVIEYILF